MEQSLAGSCATFRFSASCLSEWQSKHSWGGFLTRANGCAAVGAAWQLEQSLATGWTVLRRPLLSADECGPWHALHEVAATGYPECFAASAAASLWQPAQSDLPSLTRSAGFALAWGS